MLSITKHLFDGRIFRQLVERNFKQDDNLAAVINDILSVLVDCKAYANILEIAGYVKAHSLESKVNLASALAAIPHNYEVIGLDAKTSTSGNIPQLAGDHDISSSFQSESSSTKRPSVQEILKQCQFTSSHQPLVKYTQLLLASSDMTLSAPELSSIISALSYYKLLTEAEKLFIQADNSGKTNILHYRSFMKVVRQSNNADFAMR